MTAHKRIIEWDWEHGRRIAVAEDADGIPIGYWIEVHPGPKNGEWDPNLWTDIPPNYSSERRVREVFSR